jgi:hypothetical protein
MKVSVEDATNPVASSETVSEAMRVYIDPSYIFNYAVDALREGGEVIE